MVLEIESGEIVVPGQLLATGNYDIGESVTRDQESYYSTIVGVFSPKIDEMKDNTILKVRSLKGRYYPSVGDFVIAYVEDANLTSWELNINGPYSGILLASNALRNRFDPIKDDTRKIYDIGDVIKAEIISFDRTRDPQLTTKNHGLGKLIGGRIIETNPNLTPRIIGKKGSMISMIKNYTKSRIIVGQNGRIWVSADNAEDEERAIDAIYQISREAHVSGLTDRIKAKLSGVPVEKSDE